MPNETPNETVRPATWEELEHRVEDEPDAEVDYLCPDCAGEVKLEFHPYPRRFVIISCPKCATEITIDGLPPRT